MNGEKYVEIGRIVDAHGLRGWVRLRLYNPESETLREGLNVLLRSKKGEEKVFVIEGLHFQKGSYVLLKFQNVSSRTEGEALRGFELLVRESDLPPLEEDEYYWIHLKGCSVVAETGEKVGEVVDIIPTGGTDVLVVEEEDGSELLIPFADAYVGEVRVKEKIIYVKDVESLKSSG